MSSPSSNFELGKLIGINDTWLRDKGAVTTACSACVQNGTYSINRTTYPSVGDVPTNLMYGILVVFRSGYWSCQLAADIIMKTDEVFTTDCYSISCM